ncbi:DNA-binding protein [Tyzzerella sp. An114]|uniref:DNA-binding protein n=1 Tax=Tyzzerella sp. An114 TaxID=1965545 RepID=UPI0026A9B07C
MISDKYIQVKEVMEILHISDGKAYAIIRQLNDELKKKGFITVAGRVPRKYFNERFYLD